MTTEQTPRQGGANDGLWIAGLVSLAGWGVWTANEPALIAAAARRGLVWADAAGGWHPEPLAWVTGAAVLAVVLAAAVLAGWVAAARRWRAARHGRVPRPPAVAAAVAAAAGGTVVAVLLFGGRPTVVRVAVGAAIAAGWLTWLLGERAGRRYVGTQLFAVRAGDVLGWASPGLGQVQAGRWHGDQPAAIRATVGPAWRGHAPELAALSRAAEAAGWSGPWQWRTVAHAGVVIGERA